jgi:hypothetical protein
MPDASNFPAAKRRSPTAIRSTEPLTAHEREVLRRLVQLHFLAVNLLNEAIDGGRVEGALEAMQMCATLATEVEQAKVRMQPARSAATGD